MPMNPDAHWLNEIRIAALEAPRKGLPPLTGSERNVLWGSVIRSKIFKRLSKVYVGKLLDGWGFKTRTKIVQRTYSPLSKYREDERNLLIYKIFAHDSYSLMTKKEVEAVLRDVKDTLKKETYALFWITNREKFLSFFLFPDRFVRAYHPVSDLYSLVIPYPEEGDLLVEDNIKGILHINTLDGKLYCEQTTPGSPLCVLVRTHLYIKKNNIEGLLML